jgi:hypothetical protein
MTMRQPHFCVRARIFLVTMFHARAVRARWPGFRTKKSRLVAGMEDGIVALVSVD